MGDPIGHNRSQVKEVTRERKDDFLQFDLKPGYDAVFFGQRYTTNSQGMRDREYALEKPAGVYRIALLGSSIDMGWGVATPDTYENLLEDWLNAEAARRGLSPAVRGAQLRRRRLRPGAAVRRLPPQGPGVSPRPRPLLLDDARPPAGRDPPRRPDQEQRRPEVRLLPRGRDRGRDRRRPRAVRRLGRPRPPRGVQGQGQAELLDLRRRRPRHPRRRLPLARASPSPACSSPGPAATTPATPEPSPSPARPGSPPATPSP